MIAHELAELPTGHYRILYVDCPWQYDNDRGGRASMGGPPYPCMTVDALVALGPEIRRILHPDAAVFAWATRPKAREAHAVLHGWGLEYVTQVFTWVKTNRKAPGYYSGLGSWSNGNTEHVYLARIRRDRENRTRQGHPKRICRSVKELVFAPIGSHSAKPAEVRDRIVRLMGDLPRVELFARPPVPVGWDAWGNEVTL